MSDTIFLVNDGVVSRQTGTGPIDDLTAQKAIFAARVLDEQILNSNFNKELFSAVNRANVIADQASGRLLEPWRRVLLKASDTDGGRAAARAKDKFIEWTSELALDSKTLALAVARRDYFDGLDAYRENSAIYRKVTRKNEALAYADAQRFLENQRLTARLASARALEEEISRTKNPGFDSEGEKRVIQRLDAEVIEKMRIVTTAVDMETMAQKIRQIAESESGMLKSYRDAIKPAFVRFSGRNPMDGAQPVPEASSKVSTAANSAGQNTVTITAPEYPAKRPQPSDTSAGNSRSSQSVVSTPERTSPRPQEGSRPSVPGGGSSNGPVKSNSGSPNIDQSSAAGTTQPRDPIPAVDRSGSASGDSLGGTRLIVSGASDNLNTYSSKGYHDADGWVFNASTALWENPEDRTQTRIPAMTTCCDSTGLSFPSDAIEAHRESTGEWDRAGVDPNCNRLYRCGPAKPAAKKLLPGPADKDEEIEKAVAFLERLPADERDGEFARFITTLPSQYWRRAIIAVRNSKARNAGPGANGTTPSAARGGQGNPGATRDSDVSGLGETSAKYNPITQADAQRIVAKYQSIPGGVTLEGSSPDLSFVQSVTYVARANAFILNDDVVYTSPVTAEEFWEINSAIAIDDKLGVSLGVRHIVYGGLTERGQVVRNLKVADLFLGAIAFFKNETLENYRFAPGYDKSNGPSENVAGFFNFHEVRFAEDASGELRRSKIKLATTLVPLLESKTATGGHLPDLTRIASGSVAPLYAAHLQHLEKNFDYYAREKTLRTAMAYGEVAAFVRSLKANGVLLQKLPSVAR